MDENWKNRDPEPPADEGIDPADDCEPVAHHMLEYTLHLKPDPPTTGEGEGIDPDWGRVVHPNMMSHMRYKVALGVDDNEVWTAADVRGLSRVIRMNPLVIHRFEPANAFPFESLDTLCFALATLPDLERVSFAHQLHDMESEEGRRAMSLVNPEPLTEVLRLPSLHSVGFRSFYFTKNLCRAVAVALKERSSINTVNINRCYFLEQDSAALIASALKRNKRVTTFRFQQSPFNEAFCDAMAMSLLTNATLQDLTLDLPEDINSSTWLSSLFLALGMNAGLRSLCINGHHSNGIDLANEELCGATGNGLGNNSMLESLHLRNVILSGTDGSSGQNALSFLRTNTTLKRLTIFFQQSAMESRLSVFRANAASMLENNTSLEAITMSSRSFPPFKDYISVLSALQANTTLTYLALELGTKKMTDDQSNELISIIKKNYGLQRVTAIQRQLVDLYAILRLNEAGRQYLVKDGSSISKGVDVLSAVSDDINCLFLHLLENPRLCDRSAVETMSLSSDSDRLPNATDSYGKREKTVS